MEDVTGYQQAGEKHDQHRHRQAYDAQDAENPDGIAPAFGSLSIPAPVEDVMDDHEDEECSSKQLVTQIVQPPVAKARDDQADSEEVQKQT